MVRISKQQRANSLSGKDWLRYSISIWEINKSKEDRVDHPAVFPVELVKRILFCFTSEKVLVLDPFMGSGTTLLACQELGYPAVGFEIYEDYIALAKERLGMYTRDIRIIHDSIENA
ncbi:MAG: site-specific DNA-methyltransferase [candidate division WOR-3 bacterium]